MVEAGEMTGNNSNQRIKKRHYWMIPFFICVGFVATLFLVFLLPLYIDSVVSENEWPQLVNDFEPWIGSGLCGFYDCESNNLQLPNGVKVEISDSIIALSKNEIMFARHTKKDSKNKVTEIIVSDWGLQEERCLLSLDGTWYHVGLINQKSAFISASKSKPTEGLVYDIKSGKMQQINYDPESEYNTNNLGSFNKITDGYEIILPFRDKVFLSESQIDSELYELMNKWNLVPWRCRVVDEDTIYVSFKTKTNGFLIGNEVVIVASLDRWLNVNAYQFFKVDFSYQIGHWAYEVFDSFPDVITFAD